MAAHPRALGLAGIAIQNALDLAPLLHQEVAVLGCMESGLGFRV